MIVRVVAAALALGMLETGNEARAQDDLSKLLDGTAPPAAAAAAAAGETQVGASARVAAEPPVSPRELHARVAPAVVALAVSAGAGGTPPAVMAPGVMVTASGLVVTSRRAIAAAVDGRASLALVRTSARGKPVPKDLTDAVPARVVALADDLDLALVEALPRESVFYPHLPLARRSPPSGTVLLAAGHISGRGLWAAGTSVPGPALAATGAARWLRALPADAPALAPGSPLVDAVGRVVALVVDPAGAATGAAPVARAVVDAEGVWRFLLATGAPELRFAGIAPMRRGLPRGYTAAQRPGPASPPGASMATAAAPGTTGTAAGVPPARGGFVPASEVTAPLPAVAHKGTIDRVFLPVTKPSAGADAAPARPSRTGRGAAAPSPVTFDMGVRTVRVPLADLERYAPAPTVKLDVGGAPERGPRTAAVIVVELGDYHAPETRDVEKTVRELSDPARGPVRLYWKHADRGDSPDYHLAARATRAAAEQGEFWPMHDRVLASTRPPRGDELLRFARGMGIDDEAFAVAFGSDGMDGTLEGEGLTAGKLPVLATPSFVVNGRPVDGGSIAALALRDAVDGELAAAATAARPDAALAPETLRPPRAVGAGPAISGTPYNAAQMVKAATTAAARKAKP